MSDTEAEIVIVGGGLAGMAAAEALSRDVANASRIVLLESKRQLGGRAGSFTDAESGEQIDYCQHAAMGCCTNFISLIDRCGLGAHLRRDQELTFLHPDHPPSRFAASRWLPAPLHLLGTINAQNYLTHSQKREIKRGLWKLMRCSSESLHGMTASEWLISTQQSEQTRRAFWDVILVSALGESTDRVAMTAARKVLIDGFAAARGASDVLIPKLPLSELFGVKLADALRGRGVRIQTETAVQRIRPDRTLETTHGNISAKHVICSVPWHAIGRLFSDWDPKNSPGYFPIKITAQGGQQSINSMPVSDMPSSPITGIHLWFDRPITQLKHCVMVGTTAQWLFREPFSSHPDESSPSQHSSEPPVKPSTTTAPKAFYFQVVISASADLSSINKDQLLQKVLCELRHAFPDVRDANLLRSKIVTDPKSVFSVSPKIEAARPSTSTKEPWLQLAGDWTATGWPATMEGAVISGRRAAARATNDFGEFVEPGLTRGLLSRLLIRR